MAGVLTRTIRRRRKTTDVVEGSADPVIPLRELPYELQLMIARECVLRPVPIVVGKTIARWLSDPAEELEARTCGAMLRVSKDFRQELYRTYYEENTFELGYYYDRGNFLDHPGREFVRHILLDALRVLIQPAGVPSTVPVGLRLLPALKCVSIRLRKSLLHKTVYDAGLGKFLKNLCQALPLDTIQLLIESNGEDRGGVDSRIKEYKDFVSQSLNAKDIWPKGIPAGRQVPQFVVGFSRRVCRSKLIFCRSIGNILRKQACYGMLSKRPRSRINRAKSKH